MNEHLSKAQKALESINTESGLSREEVKLLNEVNKQLQEYKKSFMKLLRLKGYSLKSIGKAFNLTPSRVSQICKEISLEDHQRYLNGKLH